MGWTAVVRDSRVAKYEHRIRTVLNLRRDETAVLCLLFLRGPQTPGELRSRSERLYSFDGLDVVESTLERMMRAADETPDGPRGAALVTVLPRQPGSRESRYAHLLGGPIAAGAWETSVRSFPEADTRRTASTTDGAEARLAALEAEVVALRTAITGIEARLGPTLEVAREESTE